MAQIRPPKYVKKEESLPIIVKSEEIIVKSEEVITPIAEPFEPLEEGEIADEEEYKTIIVPPSTAPSPSVEPKAEPSDGVSLSITSLAHLATVIRTQSTESSRYNLSAHYLLTLTAYKVTTEELDQAKDLVLDLLGWGVTPEYLVECGVSASAICRIFTDLRLRLPTNLHLASDMKREAQTPANPPTA